MYIFNRWEVLLNIAFPYAALNVYTFPILQCYSVEFICTSGNLKQDRWNSEALEKIHTCSQMVMDMSQDYEHEGAGSVKVQMIRSMK